jgi:hypothetical protein
MKLDKIECLSSLDESNPENDNLDVLVTLEDGRTYIFVVSTPNNIYWCMENDGKEYFFGCPEVFVRRMTRENIEAALTALVVEDDGKWLEVYGALQTRISED